MGYERAMYFKKEEAPLDLSYFGLGEDFKKPTDPLTQDESVSIAETKVSDWKTSILILFCSETFTGL